MCDQSIIDPSNAWTEAETLNSGFLDTALSKSQVLNFVGRQQNGLIATNLTQSINSSLALPTATGSCSAHPACSALNLHGQCCPTPNGVHLGCCTAAAASSSTSSSTGAATTNTQKSSSSSSSNSTATTTTTASTCSAHPLCASKNLTGECCPTASGLMLGCCNNALCQANAGCAALNLQGLCCPTAAGTNLGCCA